MKKQPATKAPAKVAAGSNKAIDYGEVKKIFAKLASKFDFK